jgi:acyl-CoA thioesterase-1
MPARTLAKLLLVGLALSRAHAQRVDAHTDEEWQKIYDRGFVTVSDEPGLPRVLLIGDSISVYYTVATRALLKGEANLHRIPVNGGNTDFGLKNLDAWLGDGKWDVIHFNWGLHDLLIKANGEHPVPLDRYQANLRELVRRLQRTGAALIWATTTPAPEHIREGSQRRNSDVIAYNAAALAIMQDGRIQIDDLYAFALPRLTEIQNPEDVHFTEAGSQALAERVAAAIRSALDTRRKR